MTSKMPRIRKTWLFLAVVFGSTGILYVTRKLNSNSARNNIDRTSYSAGLNASPSLLNRHGDDNVRRVRLLIVASMRTGSSFLGQLFNQNDQFLYLFEPFLSFHDRGVKDDTWEMQRGIGEFLKNVFACNFAPHQEYLEWLNRRSVLHRIKDAPKFFGGKCLNRGQVAISCSNLTATESRRTCQSQPHMAIKTIRLRNIGPGLEAVEKSSSEKLRILLLVRDPRGKVASEIPLVLLKWADLTYKAVTRLFTKKDFTPIVSEKTKLYCSSMHRNGQLAAENNRTVRVVRFEDLAKDPEGIAKRTYDFLGLPLPHSVTEWIRNNTRARVEHKQFNPYSTKRNSSAVADAWRNRLSYDLVEAVQAECKEFMQQFGYQTFSSQQDLTHTQVSSLL